MKKILGSFIALLLVVSPVYASYTVDDSYDAKLRETGNLNAIEQTLPKLPQTEPLIDKIKGSISENSDKQYKQIKIPKGTKFKVRSRTAISSSSPIGSKVSFVTLQPETTRYITIPKDSVFTGDVTNSHQPQLTGNGGLIELKVDQLKYRGYSYPIEAKISIANHKRIYLGNIKGKRKYIANTVKMTKPGSNFLGKTWQMSCRLAHGPEILLTPIPLACGAIVYAANVVVSPALSIFSVGDPITIPANSYFEIKLLEDLVMVDY